MFRFLEDAVEIRVPTPVPKEILGGREVEFDRTIKKWVFTDNGEIFKPPARTHGTIPIVTYRKG